MNPGQAFNPYKLFTGGFVPEALMRYRGVSPGAKLAYARLSRFAGESGKCYPSISTLGEETGVSDRQARNYVAELEADGWIKRESKPGRSNDFLFIWHPAFDAPRNDPSAPVLVDRKDIAGVPRKDSSAHPGTIFPPKRVSEESQLKRESSSSSSSSENLRTSEDEDDLSFSLKAKTQTHSPEQLQQLGEFMRNSLTGNILHPEEPPRETLILETVGKAPGWTVDEIMEAFRVNRAERGKTKPPQQYSYFPKVLADIYKRWNGEAPTIKQPEKVYASIDDQRPTTKPKPVKCTYCNDTGIFVSDKKMFCPAQCSEGGRLQKEKEQRDRDEQEAKEHMARITAQAERYEVVKQRVLQDKTLSHIHDSLTRFVRGSVRFSFDCAMEPDEREPILRSLEDGSHAIFSTPPPASPPLREVTAEEKSQLAKDLEVLMAARPKRPPVTITTENKSQAEAS